MLTQPDVLQATIRILSAYLSKNMVATDRLGIVIQDIHAVLQERGNGKPVTTPPAVSIEQSLKDDTVTCLECGKPMRMLRRHLRTRHGLTVSEYKTKWHLPSTYPMSAPQFRQERSKLAKALKLGRKPAKMSGGE